MTSVRSLLTDVMNATTPAFGDPKRSKLTVSVKEVLKKNCSEVLIVSEQFFFSIQVEAFFPLTTPYSTIIVGLGRPSLLLVPPSLLWRIGWLLSLFPALLGG